MLVLHILQVRQKNLIPCDCDRIAAEGQRTTHFQGNVEMGRGP